MDSHFEHLTNSLLEQNFLRLEQFELSEPKEALNKLEIG